MLKYDDLSNMKNTRKNILIIVGGGTKHLTPFNDAAKELNIDLTLASFSDLEYTSAGKKIHLTVKNIPVDTFDVVYIRLVGKGFEEASVLINYCKDKGIKLVDRSFEKGLSVRMPYPKSVEVKILVKAGVSVPKTYFAQLENIIRKAPKIFGYPFVIKGTTGKQGHEVWSPRNEKELAELNEILKVKQDKKKMKFIAQEFIKASQRTRVFVLGGKAIAAITRPTRWRRRFVDKVNGEYPEGIKRPLFPIPEDDAKVALNAAKALYIDIGGVDVLTEDKTGKKYILEVNSAPRWAAVKADTGMDVEREILTFLSGL